MNAFSTAQRGYAANAASTRTDRRGEYEVIAQVTRRLRSAAQESNRNFAPYAEALHDNRRLWTNLAVDVAGNGNELPESLRARVIYLAEFTAQHTSKILQKRASVMPLLEINMAVLRGLKGNGTVQ
ncbi:flagellar biosynthesis regulator FlaF [Pseudosulfitobacter sp. DSM 107133]|uniref:flagellar biosynthesis regulator FlaF n=1 Tax=Pseudosulfitobacter sp. DSM 107133 TaxID=2883100 RepID=UPI000DF3CDA1|nr:flagellar biosynthesis regulator FlaF [Pseudosulfitobacter sp. DSM 107133]UOA28829.1 hypothetical protein DSM107133_03587 [Pseudosulfitobacter sp. DSM 107133]